MATKDARRRTVRSPSGVPGEDFHPIGPGVAVKSPQQVTIEVPEFSCTVVVDLVLDAQTRGFDVTTFTVQRHRGAPPMKELVRQLPLTTEIERAMRATVQMWSITEVAPGEWRTIGMDHPFDGEDASAYVARVYRLAAACGYRPTTAVQEALGIAESTAAQKVSLARKLGHLPKTRPGKAMV
jgi:hypothetical protein